MVCNCGNHHGCRLGCWHFVEKNFSTWWHTERSITFASRPFFYYLWLFGNGSQVPCQFVGYWFLAWRTVSRVRFLFFWALGLSECILLLAMLICSLSWCVCCCLLCLFFDVESVIGWPSPKWGSLVFQLWMQYSWIIFCRWVYFFLLMAAGFGLFVSEEALNVWVRVSKLVFSVTTFLIYFFLVSVQWPMYLCDLGLWRTSSSITNHQLWLCRLGHH